MSWRARGCPVSALGLVGGALAGRHRASPILQQDTSFEAELPVDRCVRGERASVCKTTSNHPASQTWRPCLLGHLRCIAASKIECWSSIRHRRLSRSAGLPSFTLLADSAQKLGTACSPLWSAARRFRRLWVSSKALPPTPARARPRQCAAGSSEAPPWTPARRSAAAGGLEPNRDTLDAHRDAANGSGHTRDAHRPPPAGSEWNRRGRLRFVNHGQGPKQSPRPRDARLHD